MRIQMITLAAGPAGVAQPGQVIEVSDDVGRARVDGGYAMVVEEAPVKATEPVETATAEPPEKAVKPTPRRRKTAPKKAAGGK